MFLRVPGGRSRERQGGEPAWRHGEVERGCGQPTARWQETPRRDAFMPRGSKVLWEGEWENVWERQWRMEPRGRSSVANWTGPEGSTDPQTAGPGGSTDPQTARPGVPHGPAVAPGQRSEKALEAAGRPRMARRLPVRSSESQGGAEHVCASGRHSAPAGRRRAEPRAPRWGLPCFWLLNTGEGTW